LQKTIWWSGFLLPWLMRCRWFSCCCGWLDARGWDSEVWECRNCNKIFFLDPIPMRTLICLY
jgi:hypothetical protein